MPHLALGTSQTMLHELHEANPFEQTMLQELHEARRQQGVVEQPA